MSNYMNYKEFFTRFYHNNSGYYTQEDIKRNKNANKVYKDFHTCCPSTKKKSASANSSKAHSEKALSQSSYKNYTRETTTSTSPVRSLKSSKINPRKTTLQKNK